MVNINQFPQQPPSLPQPGLQNATYANPRSVGVAVVDDDSTVPQVTLLRGLTAGTNVSLNIIGDDIEISAVGAGGAAEVNDLTDGYHVATNMSLGQKLSTPSGTGNLVISASTPTLTSGIDNTLIGNNAGAALTTQTGSTFVGADCASSATGQNNTVVGSDAYTNASASGNSNTIIGGSGSGSALTTGFNNVLLGKGANTASPGDHAGCIAIGIDSAGTPAVATTNDTLYFHKSLPAVASGNSARPMVYSTADGSCGPIAYGSATEVLTMTGAGTIGWASVPGGISEVNGLTDGYHVGGNIAVGAKPTTYTGTNNVHLTGTALPATVGGSFNVGVGDQALSHASLSGSNNVQIGFGAGNNISSGNGNVNLSGTNSVSSGNHNIQIGQSATVNPTGSNQIALGQGSSCTQNNSLAVNPSLSAPTASNKLVTFDTTTGEIGPTAVMAANRVMGQNSGGTALEAKNIVGSLGLTVNHTAGQIELVNDVNPVADGAIVIGNNIGVGSQITAFTAATGQLLHEKGGLEANVSAYDGFPQIKAGATSNLKTKWDATVAPAVTDDSSAGYGVGSMWIDITADNTYQCVDSSVGTAVWKQLDAAAGAVAIDNLTDAKTTASAISLGYKPATGFNGSSINVSTTGPAQVPDGLCAVAPTLPSLTGINNTLMGKSTATFLTTGTANAFYALNAGSACTTGSNNVCVGQGSNVITGDENGVIAIGAGATCDADNGIAIGANAANTIAGALNFPTALAQTTDATTTLLPMTFNTATGQVAPMNLTTATVGDILTTTATGVEWAPPAGGGFTPSYGLISATIGSSALTNPVPFGGSPTQIVSNITWSTGTNLFTISAGAGGVYKIDGMVTFSSSAGAISDARASLDVFITGTLGSVGNIFVQLYRSVAGDNCICIPVSWVGTLADGNTVGLGCSGVTNPASGSYRCFISVQRIV